MGSAHAALPMTITPEARTAIHPGESKRFIGSDGKAHDDGWLNGAHLLPSLDKLHP